MNASTPEPMTPEEFSHERASDWRVPATRAAYEEYLRDFESGKRLAHACPECNGCVNLDTMTCDECGVRVEEPAGYKASGPGFASPSETASTSPGPGDMPASVTGDVQ